MRRAESLGDTCGKLGQGVDLSSDQGERETQSHSTIKTTNSRWKDGWTASLGQTVQERRQHDVHFDAQLQLGQRGQQGLQGSQVEFVGEALDEALHEILLRYVVLAGHDLLQDARLHNLLQHVSIFT